MERVTALNAPIQIKDFVARGEKVINDNILSYDIQNGIASFRFIKRKDRNISIVEALSGKWNFFDEYGDKEHGVEEDFRLSKSFFALLTYGYEANDAICFYVRTAIVEVVKSDRFALEVFSPCLINHFELAENFDFNSVGYIDDEPCATYQIDNTQLKVYRTVAVEFNRNKVNYKFAFQKKFVGGFRFEYAKPFTNDLLKRCVDAVNEYCGFLLKDNGFFVSNVELVEPQFDVRNYIYYPPNCKDIQTEILFSFDDIKIIFPALMGLFLEQDTNFSALYVTETNIYQPIDILRIASMFENQYRKNVDAKITDYVEQENLYREAYCNAIEIKQVEGTLEKAIIDGENARRKQPVMSTLKKQLEFVFNKLLALLETNKTQVKNSIFAKLYNFDISNLANTIKDARNDIAHYLENGVNYQVALKNTYVLQLMIYYMVFERIGLANDNIKKIILGCSRMSDWLFGIKSKK